MAKKKIEQNQANRMAFRSEVASTIRRVKAGVLACVAGLPALPEGWGAWDTYDVDGHLRHAYGSAGYGVMESEDGTWRVVRALDGEPYTTQYYPTAAEAIAAAQRAGA